VTARRRTAGELYDVAFAAFDAAGAQSRVELAESDARVARLKLAAELERNGRQGRPPSSSKCLAPADNEYRVFGPAPVETIDIDAGRADLRDPDEFAEWRQAQLAVAGAVTDPDAAGYIRQVVATYEEIHGHGPLFEVIGQAVIDVDDEEE
jgi:hypothetical protein